ncbi:MAG: diguanylate cyclase [Methylophaga sp.]|nr:diguanylate cyclase [Methylophaga sp.]
MKQLSKTLILSILLTIAYFISGQFTLTLSLPPSGATPLWAPTGIATAAVLIWGYRLLPAVFLGDFIVAVDLIGVNDSISISMCVLIGFQAMMQAGLARWLLVHYKVWPSTLIKDGNIFKFFILAGIVSSLIPALFTVAVDLLLGVLAAETWLESLLVWWVGGALGIVVFTPIVLILFASPRESWKSRLYSVALPMTILFVLLVAVLQNAREQEHEQIVQRFSNSVEHVHAIAETKLEVQASLLQSMRAYFQNSEFVSKQEFDDYLKDLSSYKRDVFSVVWIEYVNDENRSAYEQNQGYKISELSEDGQQFITAKQRQDYYVVKYSELPSGHQIIAKQPSTFLGFNVCSGEQGQKTCQEIALSQQSKLISPILELSDPDAKNRFVYLSPVMKGEHMRGIVGHVFKFQQLFHDLLIGDSKKWLEVTITDLSDNRILFSTIKGGEVTKVIVPESLIAQREVTIGDRTWQFTYTASQHFIDVYSTWTFFIIITGAFVTLSLMGMFLLGITGRVQRVKQEVDSKTALIREHSKSLEKSEEKYRGLVENITDKYFIYQHNIEGVFTYVSPSIEAILGYSVNEFLKHYTTYMPNSKLNKKIGKLTDKTLAGESSHSYDVEIFNKSGSLHTLRVTETPVLDAEGKTQGVYGIARDITHSKRTHLELEKLSLAVQHSPNSIIITNKDGVIEYVNPKFTSITGYTLREVLGGKPSILKSGLTPKSTYKKLWDTLLSGSEWRGDMHNRKKNGGLYWAREHICPLFDENNDVSHFIATQEDVTEAKKLSEETSYQASHDLLTGLVNRREFEFRLDRVVRTAKDETSEHALCFMDLDQFKIVNDTCGHVAGDELLRQVGDLLLANVRQRDTLARLGGDEFSLLMEHCGLDQAYDTCQKIIDLLADFRFHWEDHVFTIGISIGLAQVNKHIQDSHEALRHVDGACYAAKDAGRNRIEVYTEDSDRLKQRQGEIQWSNEINDALDNDRFELYCQPIIPLADPDSGISYEVLLRLRMPDDTIVPPGAFLPAAERYNSITRIDRWVIEHTLLWVSRHAERLNHVKSMSINLSGQSLGDEAMLGFIIREFQRGDVPVEKIKFEITETAAIANLRDATVFMRTLSEFGCRFALDDFGSGLRLPQKTGHQKN